MIDVLFSTTTLAVNVFSLNMLFIIWPFNYYFFLGPPWAAFTRANFPRDTFVFFSVGAIIYLEQSF